MPGKRRWWFAPEHGEPSGGIMGLQVVGALLLLSLVAYWVLSRLAYYQWNWAGVWTYREMYWKGWVATVAISSASLVLSTLIGTMAALARRARFLPLRALAQVYVELIRGTPLLVQILILYYCVFDAVRLHDIFISGVLILSIFSGAYISEMIRGGIEGVAESQIESARAVGFDTVQTYRYVVFPQAIRLALPALAGQFASLIKDSSLLSVIALGEFTLRAQEVNSFTYSTFESYIPLAVGYFALTFPISMFSRYLEDRFRYAS